MASTIKVDNYDLSTWQRLQPEDGYDPTDSAYSEPQFAGSPAFSEGAAWTTDAVGNRKLSIPLILKGSSTDDLYRVVREINTHLFKGARVEFAMDNAAASTFFDLERGRVDANFEYYIARAGRLRCVLELWTRPFGNTGTARSIASVAGTGAIQLAATGILGDQYAEAKITASSNTIVSVSSYGWFFAWGVHRSASFNGVHRSTTQLIAPSPTTIGDAGAIASQYLGMGVSPTGATNAFADIIDPQEAGGRYRILAIIRNRIAVPSTAGGLGLAAVDQLGNVIGSVGMPVSSYFRVFDLGELSVPSVPSAFSVSTQPLNFLTYGASGASSVASPGLHVEAVIHLPLSENAGIVVASAPVAETLEVNGIGGLDSYGINNTSFIDRSVFGPGQLRGDAPRIPVPLPGGNLLTDSSLEVAGLPAWNVYDGGTPTVTIARDAAGYAGGYGAFGAKVTRTTSLGYAGIYQGFTHVPGRTYTLSAWVNPSASLTAALIADWNLVVGGYALTSKTFSVSSGWQRITFTYTVPAGTTAGGGDVYVALQGATAGQYMYVDQVQLEDAGAAAPYSPSPPSGPPRIVTLQGAIDNYRADLLYGVTVAVRERFTFLRG